MKRMALGLAAAVLLLLTGCEKANPPTKTDQEDISIQKVKLDDGRTVLCVVHANRVGSGMSCDWEGAK